jgi:probable aminopeptidase NPEPL1
MAVAFRDALLKPLEALAFHSARSLKDVVAGGHNICLVGKQAPLCAAAGQLAQLVGEPVILKQAEAMNAEYKGCKKEVPWMNGDVTRKVTLLALPEAAGRVVTPVRPDAIAKHLHGCIAGQEVVLAVTEDDVVPAGLAVARCLSPYTAKLKAREASLCNVSFHGCSPSDASIAQVELMASSIRAAQGLVDMPPNVLTPTTFKEFVLDAVSSVDQVTHTIIEGEALREQGYGLIYAVGKCSVSPPCIIVLSHPGSRNGHEKHGVALVGKGITFDTGGAALKPREGMCGMKRDMGGAAGCFGAFLALAKGGGLSSGQPLHCVLCVAENSIGSKAFLQDDIIKGYSGLTVEVNNTDAEGRLVLSDGVSHVAKHLDCELVMDMATLTGAQGISTGTHHGLVLASDAELEHDVVKAGRESGDMVHPGIFAPEILMHEFDSEFADLKNSVKNRSNAQASCAGLFIHRHLTQCGYSGRWLHIDMAYPSHEPLGEFSTGWGVALLAHYLSKLEAKCEAAAPKQRKTSEAESKL